MLCSACQRLFSAVRNSAPASWAGSKPQLFRYLTRDDTWAGAHHFDFGSFLSAVEENCYICFTIYRDCSDEARKQVEGFSTFYEIRSMPKGRYTLHFTIEVLEGQNPIAAKQVISCIGTFQILPEGEISVSKGTLPLTSDTFSDKCRGQIQQWLKYCKCHHSICNKDWRSSHSYPLRLLDVGRPKSKQIRLKTFSRDTSRPKYVTMSHCWGLKPEMTVMLSKATHASFEAGLTITQLPNKFRDAVEIAHWMGVRYLWIDALCIIQDDADDWHQQSTVMGDIYAGSYCNIAATSGDREKGCFTERNRSIVEPYSIADPQSTALAETHVMGYSDFWCNSLLDTSLHHRAWVLQERLLSPRTIYFGQEQMFWECRTKMACEAYPEGIPPAFRNQRTDTWRHTDKILDPENRMKPPVAMWWSMLAPVFRWFSSENTASAEPTQNWAYGTWSKCIERYMECDLTFGKDKLVAISGIAQKMAEATGENYLAGLWANEQLPQSLLWFVPARRQANSTLSRRPLSGKDSVFRAPSWSWASVDASITWNWPAQCGEILIDIIDTFVEEVGVGKMGAVSSANMTVEGRLFPAQLGIMSTNGDGSLDEDGRYEIQLETESNHAKASEMYEELTMEPTVYLDTNMMPRAIVQTYLLPICRDWQDHSGDEVTSLAGLLLERVETSPSEQVYSRIGVFGLDPSQAQVLDKCYVTAETTSMILI